MMPATDSSDHGTTLEGRLAGFLTILDWAGLRLMSSSATASSKHPFSTA